MSKTPVSTVLFALAFLASLPEVSVATQTPVPSAHVDHPLSAAADPNTGALDIHGALAAPPSAANGPWPFAAQAGEGGRLNSPLEFGGGRSADLPLDALTSSTSPSALALPLSQVAGGVAKTPGDSGPFGLWTFLGRVRDGGLPEPASWALILIGFGMIGGALRGFMVTNRRLAGLQPQETDTAEVEGVE